LNFKEFFDRYIRGWLPAEAKMQKHSPIKPIAAILFVFISFSLIVFLLISFMIAAPSIGGLIEWDKTYGKEHIIEWGGPIVESSDEGYVMAGRISSSWEDDGELLLAKIDENGNMDWNKTYQGTSEVGNLLVATSDGGYAIAGSTTRNAVESDFLLIKTDSFGNIEWSQTYGKNNSDGASSLVATSDGGYAIAGYTYPISGWVEPNIIEFLLVKTDAYGNMEWNKTYGEVLTGLSGRLLITTSDGGFALAGTRLSDDNLVFGLIKTDEKGNVQWNQTYGEKGRDYIARSIVMTSDGGYAVVGQTFSYGLDDDFFLVKIDAYGNMEWKQKYGDDGDDWEGGQSCVVSALDGGYLLAGITCPDESYDSDLFLVKTDEYGNMEWNQTYGGPGMDRPYFMIKTSDNKYVISGATSISIDMDLDIWLIKIDEHGKALQPESEP
jgi:hypothetical protein